jgi:two-component system, chemotaxis family, protein-glutamate methylesterase/glutaminase
MSKEMINTERLVRDVVTIGASAGGVMALMRLLELLPSDLAATLTIVLHRSPFHETQLPLVLGRRAGLAVLEPTDGEPIQRGVVYVAPRDHHMVLYDGTVRLDRGPKQHRTRPAIDPLFRSAAAIYGRRVVGILMSGMGGDGVSGLIDIKQSGGISLVQSPAEAQFPTMPSRAIREDDVDAALTVTAIAEALPVLAAGGVVEPGPWRAVAP